MRANSVIRRLLSLVSTVALFIPEVGAVQDVFDPSSNPPAFSANRLTGHIVVDGVLNEDIWLAAPAITEFVQKEPVQQAVPSYATEVRFAYDENALYIAAICFQPRRTRIGVCGFSSLPSFSRAFT